MTTPKPDKHDLPVAGNDAGSASRPHRAFSPVIGAGAVTAVLLVGLWWTAGWYQSRLLHEQRSRMHIRTAVYGQVLASTVNSYFSLLEGLAAFVAANPAATFLQDSFPTFAAGLHAGREAVLALQVFTPDMPVLVFPLHGNQAVIGRSLEDLINDEREHVRTDVDRALRSRRIARSAPFHLRQGGLGLVIRKAVYQEDALWGIVTIVLRLPPIIRDAGLDDPAAGMNIRLHDRHGEVFWTAGRDAPRDPIAIPINLPDGDWVLSAAPTAGWKAGIRSQMDIFQWLGGACIILLAALVYTNLNRQSLLARRVREQTATLAESEERYRALFDANSDAMFVLGPNGKIVAANQTVESIYGYTAEELGRMAAPDLSPTDRRDRAIARIRDAMERPIQFEWLHRKKDGSAFPVHINARPIEMQGARCVLASVRDVSRHKAAEAQNRESLAKFKALADQSITGIYIFQKDRFRYVNRRFTDIFGYPEEEVMETLKPTDVIAVEDKPMAAENVRRRLDGEIHSLHYVARGKRKDGILIWVEIHGSQMQLDGEPAITGTVLDITARRKAEMDLQAAKEQLEAKVRERTAELRKLVDSMAGRELRMAELKKLNAVLKEKIEQVGPPDDADHGRQRRDTDDTGVRL